MFKPETISKYIQSAKTKIDYFKSAISKASPEDFKVSISKGNSKIGKVMNVSISPVITCGNCSECMGICYDIKANIQYGNVLEARCKNTVLAMDYRDYYFDEIDKAMSRRRANKYMRWHVGGEIPDFDYFCRMVENARRHKDFVIWTYTKMYGIVNRYCDLFGRDAIPENMVIMFSKWDGVPMNNPYNFPVFACRLKDGNKDEMEWDAMYKCPGNCDICKACNGGCICGMDTYNDEH